MIDLHCHSTASDGTYSPAKLIQYAKSLDITHFALTDHDTIDGIDEFCSQNSLIKTIPGVELSVDYNNGELHMVGLLIDRKDKALNDILEEVKVYRNERNILMMQKLSALVKRNIKIGDLTDNPKGQLGRPHMAKYLLKNGFVATIEEAFDKYLAEGSPFNVPKKRLSAKGAIDAIKNAGGVAVLAHPSKLKLEDDELENLVKQYTDLGLDGIEAFSGHSPIEKRYYYKELADKYGLIITGGSDFHGGNSKILSLGANFDKINEEKVISDLYKRGGK